jgi:hypothetical protein
MDVGIVVRAIFIAASLFLAILQKRYLFFYILNKNMLF